MNEKKRVVCSNCGSYKINHKWINKSQKHTFKDISFEEKAKDLKLSYSGRFFSSGDLHFPQLSDFIQLVLTCNECNYTECYKVGDENGVL